MIESEVFHIMIPPLVACLVLTGMHAYLGLHIIRREVIFVDLALAQIAALGTTVGFLLGFEWHSEASYLTSLAFAICGAIIFSLTRFRRPVVPHEAIIGIVYVICAAACILVLSRAPEGGEQLKSLLVGHLLFVNWREIAYIAVIYSVIGVIHWAFRKRLLLISFDPETAFNSGVRVRWWDFVFYCTFAFVVTSSVDLAGVLLVFSFLVIPAVCAALITRDVRQRLFIGWTCGALTSIAGLIASYYWDFPPGAAVVCMFCVPLLLIAAMSRLCPDYFTR